MTKYKDELNFYNSYSWEKVSRLLFSARLRKWIPMERAINPKSLRIKSNRINVAWRECTDCKKYKYWNEFAKDLRWYMEHSPNCLDCRNKRHKKLRENEEYHEKEKQYKRDLRKTERWILNKDFDNLFYSNPQIKKNREIIKTVRKISKKESVEWKIKWLLNRWIEKEKLCLAYNLSGEDIKSIKKLDF